MSHRTRIMILVIAAVLPWALIIIRGQVLVGAYFENGTFRQDFLLFLAVLLQVPVTVLVAWGFKPSWHRALGVFVANNLFFLAGWYLLGFYLYEACREL